VDLEIVAVKWSVTSDLKCEEFPLRSASSGLHLRLGSSTCCVSQPFGNTRNACIVCHDGRNPLVGTGVRIGEVSVNVQRLNRRAIRRQGVLNVEDRLVLAKVGGVDDNFCNCRVQ
jgi:hypothetical protein